MKDLVTKGRGDSRYLKSVSDFITRYPTYADFAAALVAGTLPVDFNGFNASGITQQGTPLNKANLLTDATAAAIGGLGSNPTVNDALYGLSQRVVLYPIVRVFTVPQTVVTITKDAETLTVTAGNDGYAVFTPKSFGTWTAAVTLDGSEMTQSIVIDTVKIYSVTLAPTLENASWAFISSVAKAGYASVVWSVGDTKNIKVDNTTYLTRIIGFNHDTPTSTGTYGRSKAGITFQLTDVLSTNYAMNDSNTNAGGWANSKMRNTHLRTTIWGQLQSALKNVIVEVNKVASAGEQSASLVTSHDTLFLLSEIEIFGQTTWSKAGEGTQYEWYRAGNSTIKYQSGRTATSWWERSPSGSSSTSFCTVDSAGSAYRDSASTTYGVAFGFCV